MTPPQGEVINSISKQGNAGQTKSPSRKDNCKYPAPERGRRDTMKLIITAIIAFVLGAWFGMMLTALIVAGRDDK